MKKQKISLAINEIDEKFIEEATLYKKGEKRALSSPRWIKWTAVAACFALFLAIGIPILSQKFAPADDMVDSVWMIKYENAYYEIIENSPKALEKFGIITTDIDAELAGEHISYLKRANPDKKRSDCIPTDEETELELLEYAPAKSKAIYVFRDRDIYYIARLCNYIIADSESLPTKTAFDVYGIKCAADIKSITPTPTDNTWAPSGSSVTDKDIIAALYDEIVSLNSYSEQAHDELVFGKNIEEENARELYENHANDLHVLIVETVDGLRFTIEYYPSYKWIYLSQTQTYCQITPTVEAWINNNIK